MGASVEGNRNVGRVAGKGWGGSGGTRFVSVLWRDETDMCTAATATATRERRVDGGFPTCRTVFASCRVSFSFF